MPNGFKPIINNESRILIMGTLPSVTSLVKNEYYAHSKNQFWDIIYSIFDIPVHDEYEKRYDFLLGNGIALWDVLKSADREGSLDSDIKKEVPNNFEKLFYNYPELKILLFNGTTAEKLFKKHLNHYYMTMVHKTLPSSSPMRGKNVKTVSEKKIEWAKAIRLNDLSSFVK